MYEKKLMSLGQYFCIDKAAISAICGDKGSHYVKAKFEEQCISSVKRYIDVGEAAHAATTLMQGGLYKWAHPTTQGEISQASKMLTSLVDKSPPATAEAMTAWLQTVYIRLPWFIKTDVEVKVETESADGEPQNITKTIFGAEAVQHKWEALWAKSAAPTLSDFEDFGVWRHLLSASQAKQMDESISKLYSKSAASSSSSSNSNNNIDGKKKKTVVPAPKPKAKPSGKASVASMDATAMAMGLLGL